jgi:hypothetical protein
MDDWIKDVLCPLIVLVVWRFCDAGCPRVRARRFLAWLWTKSMATASWVGGAAGSLVWPAALVVLGVVGIAALVALGNVVIPYIVSAVVVVGSSALGFLASWWWVLLLVPVALGIIAGVAGASGGSPCACDGIARELGHEPVRAVYAPCPDVLDPGGRLGKEFEGFECIQIDPCNDCYRPVRCDDWLAINPWTRDSRSWC